MPSAAPQKTSTPTGTPPATLPLSATRLYWAGAAVSFLFSLVLYVKTLAASASFWDSGEFIAAAYSLGVPHSPGTPLYVLVGRVFAELPLPFFSVAERVNLLSAFCGALGVFFVYVLVVRFLDFVSGRSETFNDTLVKVTGGLVGALFIMGSDTYWNNSIEAEVYAMSTALMGFMTWLSLKWAEKPLEARSTSLIYLLFYLLALSVGFHLGTILAFSGIFFLIYLTKDKAFSNTEFVVACVGVGIVVADATLYRNGQLTLYLLAAFAVALVWMYAKNRRFPAIATVLFILGLSVHMYLKIRSFHNPSIDMGDPETWRRLYAVLRREQYPPMNTLQRKADFLFQLSHFNGYFQTQFQMASVFVSKLNLGSILPVGLGIWGMVDQFSRHKKTFVMLFVTLVVVSLGLIIFLNFSDDEVRERDYFYSPAFYYFAIYIGIGAASVLGELKNRVARKRVAVLGVLAIAFLALPVFTIEHNYFSHDRSNNYLCPSFARNMLKPLDQDAILFTNGDNDTYPLWYIQEVEGFRKDVKVICLSLLDTPWYIKQCRDNAPRVPIAWTDDRVDLLMPIMTTNGILRVKDITVQHILKNNNWKRPIYFAVTIPRETYAPYREFLEMEGLVYRVVPKKGENMVDVKKLEQSIRNEFDYSGILNEDFKRDGTVYLAPHAVHLIQNYAAAFIQLAFEQHKDSLFTKAVESLEIAHEISPQRREPVLLLGWYCFDAGDSAKAIQFYRDYLRDHPDDVEVQFNLAGIYERVGQTVKALEALDNIVLADPENRDAMLNAAGMAYRAGLIRRAKGYLTSWLERHPGDNATRETLQDIEQQEATNPPESP